MNNISKLTGLNIWHDLNGQNYAELQKKKLAATNDPRGLQSFAFAYGNIHALIQAVDQLA